MQRTGCSVAAAMLILGTFSATAETFVVTKVVDRADVTEFKVMSPASLKALQLEISTEAKFHAKALALARNAWGADDTETEAFPANAIGTRSASAVGMPYEDEERANEKCARAEERLTEKAIAEAKKHQGRLRSRYGADYQVQNAKLKASAAEKRTREDRARVLYERELATLTGGKAAAAP